MTTVAAARRTSSAASAGGVAWARYGSRGLHVALLQKKLNERGARLAVDGIFGPKTLAAVKRFQQQRGLAVDGIVGPKTWGALGVKAQSHGGNVGGTTPSAPAPSGPGTRTTGYVNGRPVSITVSPIGNGKYLRSDAAAAFNRMKADAARAGVTLTPVSGFRTMAEQTYLYNLYRQGRGNLAARPGYSNHQQGLSVDVSTGGSYSSAAYRWLAANGRRYGFVNDVGGEPWHWTYRG
ncbi:MAG: D-alanyl-D-alanine carboxypeptidase family protein [Myxococcota bacterium]